MPNHAPLPLIAARALALHAQRLLAPAGTPTPDTIYDTVDQLGCVQIDTLHMVQRSHYLVLWSRLGQYKPADFNRLIYDPDHRRLFEYWQHAASIIPLTEYRYRLHTMRYYREGSSRWQAWLGDASNRAVVEEVRARIQQEGALRAADFKHDGHRGGTWWDWKPAKRALEYFYNRGELMIADRVNFQRVYDFRERVLPEWVDTSEPTLEETHRHNLEKAAQALGIGQPGQIADYAYMKRGDAAPVIADLLVEGILVEVETELADESTDTLVMHRDTLPLVEQTADGTLKPERTTFLSPFDSLFWARNRDQQFWNFRQSLEAYKPEPQRIWGYFCLPILHHERLVGRFDPKLERKNRRLILRALYLEPGIDPADDLIADVAAAMRDFMAWHGATDLVIDKSDPVVFGEKLLVVL
jgi:uncharacterized protein YcaQ